MKKKHNHQKRKIPLVAWVLGGVFLFLVFLLVSFFIDRTSHHGLIPRNVEWQDIALGNLSAAEAVGKITSSVAKKMSEPIVVVVRDQESSVTLKQLGFSSDVTELQIILDREAARYGCHAPRFRCEFIAWLGSLFGTKDLAKSSVVLKVEDKEKFKNFFKEYLAQNASFNVSDPLQVAVIPGKPGIPVTQSEFEREFLRALYRSPSRIDLTPYLESEPEFTTQEAEELGIKHLIAEYTTYHACCQNRVQNIHLVADLMDDVVVMPGESFDLNKHLGERTDARGFLMGGTIVKGELTETIGGGISQFATTFYNAVFWSGIRNIISKEHAFYFSRYPEGIEATISWPYPDLIFTNDYKTPVLLKTRYTNTSITVGVYGDNDGRVFRGSWYGGRRHKILAEGGPNARRVTASIGERYNIVQPTTDAIYNFDPTVRRGTLSIAQEAGPGWSVDMVRNVISSNPADSFTQKSKVTYIAHPTIYKIHPCDVVGVDDKECVEQLVTKLP